MVVIVRRLGDPLPGRAFVWVDSWQQQCCGEEFRVGSEIHWHGHRTKERKSWITTLLGAEWADAVEYEENHHGPLDELNPLVELHGMVRSIRVVTCDRKAKANSTSSSGMPVPGSGRLQMVRSPTPGSRSRPPKLAGCSPDGSWSYCCATDSEEQASAVESPAVPRWAALGRRAALTPGPRALVHDDSGV